MPQLTFGQRLKQARLACDLSQAGLAAPRLTKAFISLLERDGARPSLETLLHLAERLNRPLQYLVAALDPRAAERVLAELDERGRAALAQRRFDPSLEAFEQLRDLAAAVQAPEAAAAALLGRGEALIGLHRLDEADTLLGQSEDRARRAGDRLMECRALRGLGLVAHNRGRLHDAVARYRAALALVPALPKPAPVLHGEVLAYLSTMYVRLGRFDEAMTAAVDALALLEPSAPARAAEVRMNLGLIHYGTGDYAKALEEYGHALRTAEEYEDLRTMFRLRNNLAMVLIELGRPGEATQHLGTAVTMARRLSDVPGECRALTEVARCRLALGAVQDARAAAEEAVGRSHAAGLADEAARACIVLGVVSAAERQMQRALRYLTGAYRHAAESGMTVEVIVAGRLLARVLSHAGKDAAACRIHDEVFAALRRLPAHETQGVVWMTKPFAGALDRAPSTGGRLAAGSPAARGLRPAGL